MASTPGVVGNQQAAGGRAHEHLDAGAAGQPLERGELGDVLVRAADIEGEVAVHAAGGAGDLVLEGLAGGGQRVGVGHLEDAGDAAHDRGERAGREVFLVLEAGLAEMHLGVDDAGEDVEAGAVVDFGGGGGGEIADGGDAPPMTPMSAAWTPSWLTTVPFLKIAS
jgi:hypothetical protein